MNNPPNDAHLKFTPDGFARPYYGNTIISYLTEPDSDVYQASVAVQNEIKASPLADCLVFLPPSSFHFTVLTLCREIDRHGIYWPQYIPGETKFKEIDRILSDKVAQIPYPNHIQMRMVGGTEKHIALEAAGEKDRQKLKNYRDTVAELTGIRHYLHDTFRYHVTLTYINRKNDQGLLVEKEALRKRLDRILIDYNPVFSAPSAVFAIFNDMLSYETDLSKRGDLY